MVRVKRAIPGRESAPVFACSQELASIDYLEWQIGYDTADATAASRVPAMNPKEKGKGDMVSNCRGFSLKQQSPI